MSNGRSFQRSLNRDAMKKITSSAFPEPNHTQVPNNFFEMIPDMEGSELLVTLIMIRETFGWHRLNFKLGVAKIQKRTGLSYQGTLDGIAAAEKRGTFYRTNPGSKKEAEWALVVEEEQPLMSGGTDLQPVEDDPLLNRPHSPIKESTKEKRYTPPKPSNKPPSPSKLITDTMATHFKIGLNPAIKAHLTFLTWAVEEAHLTPEMIEYARLTWDGDTTINWRGTRSISITAVTEEWPKLIDGYKPFDPNEPKEDFSQIDWNMNPS